MVYKRHGDIEIGDEKEEEHRNGTNAITVINPGRDDRSTNSDSGLIHVINSRNGTTSMSLNNNTQNINMSKSVSSQRSAVN